MIKSVWGKLGNSENAALVTVFTVYNDQPQYQFSLESLCTLSRDKLKTPHSSFCPQNVLLAHNANVSV